MKRVAPSVGRATALWMLVALLGCRDRDPPKPSPGRRPVPAVLEAPTARASVDRYEFLSQLDGCDVDHDGLLVDFGTAALAARRRFGFGPFVDMAPIDRDGATFDRVLARTLSFDVWLDKPLSQPTLSLRVHGGVARTLSLGLDEARLGALRLPAEETKIMTTSAGAAALGRGRHRLSMTFSGAPRSSKDAMAEIDWLRLGERALDPSKYAAPTYADIVADIALDRIPKRGLVLRAPSAVRCFFRPARDARLNVAVGFWGSGKGTAEIRLLRGEDAPVLLESRKVVGGEGATWTPLELDLSAYSASVVGLEFAANEATRGGRVAFGDPAIVHAEQPQPSLPRARVAILVVLSSAERARLPPWGPTGVFKTLAELGRAGTAFSSHRASSTVPAAALASVLTGLAARAHGLEDPSNQLAPELHLVSEIVKEASGTTAMFTGAPVSFAAFGFDQGWDVFEAISPVKDSPSSEPIQRANRWLEQALDQTRTGPLFVLVHAHGSHPPWDVSREEAVQLKPPDYAGILDARRGGMILSGLRARRQRSGKRLLDDDWTRLRALAGASLAKQDQALGQLVAQLKRNDVWDQTLFAVTGDVGPGEPPELPFDPKGALSEDRLIVPLIVKFPGNLLVGKEIQGASASEDLAVTLLASLGLAVPKGLNGSDLELLAQGRESLGGRIQVATLPDRYAARLGQWLLRGQTGRTPTLCALDIDPACVTDTFEKEIIAARALWQATYWTLSSASKVTPPLASRRVVGLDEETAAALTVWGD